MTIADDFREEARANLAGAVESFGPAAASLESTLMCMHEWQDHNQAPDDFHHCTRPAEHTGPHTCGWCEEMGRT